MSETTAALPGTPTQAELEQIRRYTRRDFAPEELYVFPAVLCDNQIDRVGTLLPGLSPGAGRALCGSDRRL